MERIRLRCQICHNSFHNVFAFKSHVRSHGKEMKEIFPNDSLEPSGYIPYIVFVDSRSDLSKVVGLSHLTLVCGGNPTSCFYLCHVCHLKQPVKRILEHLDSWDHFTNFLSITDPNSLVFSWMPQKEKNGPHFCLEYARRNGDLWILQLPTKLHSELRSSLYSDVMHTLSRNEKLFKRIQEALPETDLIHTYQKDSKRESPLLGLHHIVECVCVGLSNERLYLCTLCQLTFAAHMIIKHVLSFDHIFRYFEEWHPSTLLSKASYIKDSSFPSMILDLAKQAEEIQGCTHMQSMKLEPDEFKSVDFKSYSQALMKLEAIQKCSLQISIKPGRKLVHCPSTPVVQSTQSASFSSIFKIRCQVCDVHFSNMFWFRKHLSQANHQKRLFQVFDNGANADTSRLPVLFILGIYSYIQRCLRINEPLVGIPMIVSCVSTEAKTDPVYLCVACSDHFTDSYLEQHLSSEKHLMHTLYQDQDPEALPFAWKSFGDLNMAVLKAKVWEREKAGRALMSMKVVDLPCWILCNIKTKRFSEALAVLEDYDASLRDGVPTWNTDCDLQAPKKIPLLGNQFLVMYEAQNTDSQPYTAFLCLLCQRKLHVDESCVHIFGQEHVATFLEKFHSGSLNSSNVNAKCLLDLAQQAQIRHPTERIQVVNLTRPVRDTYSYKKTTAILRDGGEMFEPKIQPKGRLVPSEDHVRGHRVAKTQNVGKKGTKNISSEQRLSLEKEVIETVSEVKKKSQETNESEVRKTSKEDPGSGPSTVKEDVGELCEQEDAENDEIIPTRLETCSDKSRRNKRSIGMCGGSQDETTSGEDARHKRRRITSEGESGLENESTDDMETSHKSHQDERLRAVYDIRWNNKSVYLCECCSMKIPNEELLSHCNGSGHPNVHMKTVTLEEDVYRFILKQSVESVIPMVSMLFTRCDIVPERPSTSTIAPSTLKQEEIQLATHDQHIVDSVRHHIKVENLKTEDDSETSEAAASMPVMTWNTTQAPELMEDTKSHVSNFEWASTAEENLPPPDLSGKLTEADSTLNSDLESLRTETALKVDERMTFSVICSATSSPCTATTDEVMEVTSASSAAASPTDSVTTSALSLKTETASDAKSALQNAEPMSPKRSTEVREAPSTMADNTPKYLEPAPAASGICQKLPKSVATAKKSTPAVKGNRVEEKVDVSPHIHETTQSAAPQATAAIPGRPNELPLAATNKTKPIYGSVKIGEDQLIVLNCSKRHKAYCQLCSVRLQSTDHLREMNHQYNYVQMKFPGWTATPLEDSKKFQEAVTMLAKEQECCNQTLEVTLDVYEEVNRLPVKIALQRLKEMLKEKSSKDSSLSRVNNVAALQKKVVIGSPCEVTSSDDGVNMEKKLGCVKPQVSCPRSTSTLSKTPAASKETSVSSKQEPRKVPLLQDTRKTPGDARNTSDVTLSQDPRVEPAAGDKEVQSQSRSSYKEDQAAKHHTRPGRRSSSEELSTFSIGVNVDNNRGCVKPQVRCPESTFSKTPATSKETSVSSQQPPRKVPQLQDIRKIPGDARNTSDVTLSRDPRVEPAAGDKDELSRSRSSCKKDQAAKHHTRPGRRSSSEELSTISIVNDVAALQKKVIIGSPREVTSSDDGVDVESNRGCVKPQIGCPESTSTFSKTPAASKETPVGSKQSPMKVPQLQDPRKTPGDARKTLDVTFLGRDPRVEPAAGDEVQSQSRSYYQKDQAAKHHTRPGRKSSSEELPTISIGVDVGNNRRSVKPQVVESTSFSKAPATSKETPVSSQQQPRKVPQLQDTQKTPGDAQKTSEVKFVGRDQRVEPADNKVVQSQSRSSNKEDQAAKHHTRPGRSSSEELSTIPIGKIIDGQSHLRGYLRVKNMDSEPIIGQDTVWECKATLLMPFYLCESCELMLQFNNICQHMISQNHKLNYLQKHHTELFDFWTYQDLTEEQKQEVLDVVTSEVANRECVLNIQVKLVYLGTDFYKELQNSPFSHALKRVQSIAEGTLRAPCSPDRPPSQKSQQLESLQSSKPSPPTKTQSRPTPETGQRRKKESKQKHLKEATMDGELHDFQKRKASSPLDARSLHSKPDSVIAPLPQDGTHIQPKKMCTSLAVQKKVVPPVSQHQTETVPVLAANQKDGDSKSLSSRPGDPEVAQTLPLPDPPSEKRPADPSVETLVRSCNSNSSKNSVPPKSTAPPLQPIQEPSSVSAAVIAVHPAVTPISLPLEPENTKSISDQQNIPPTYFTVLSQIISALRVGTKKALTEAVHRSAVTSIPSDEGKASLASECIERNTTDRDWRISGEIPQNQLVTHRDGSASAAINSPFENSCVRNDPALVPESKAASGVVMTTTTTTASLAESNDPQGSTGQLTCSAVATSVTKPETSDACPINTIVTGRGNYAYGYVSTGGSKGPGPTEVSSVPQAGLSTGSTAPAPATYAKYSEATDGKGGHSVYKIPVNPTFSSPANMVVNALANTVNSAVNPHAGGHPHVVTDATSMITPPDSSQSAGHSAMGFYSSHNPSGINYVHLQPIGHSSAVGMEPTWTNVEMQQYQYQQQYQYYQQQQRYQQHEYYRQQQHYRLQQYLQQQQQYSNQQPNQNQQQGWYQQSQ